MGLVRAIMLPSSARSSARTQSERSGMGTTTVPGAIEVSENHPCWSVSRSRPAADLDRGVPRHVAAACGDRVDDRLGGKRFGADDRVGRGDVAAAVEVGRSDGEFAVAAHEQGMP